MPAQPGATLKFLADPLFPEGIVAELGSSGYDAVHAAEIGAGDLPLREILKLAVLEARVLLSMNQGLVRFVEAGGSDCPSIVLFRQRNGTPESMGQILVGLLPLFGEDLAAGAMVIVRDAETLLKKFPPVR